MIKVFVDGAAGTTGLEIVHRLESNAAVSLIRLDDADRKDVTRRRSAINAADFVILCLPDDAAREAVSLVERAETRVIDASSAHRVDPVWAYGFPELSADYRSAIRQARQVSNPGCYPTGFLSLVGPLVRDRLIAPDARLTVNAVSGYSGGGRAMIDAYRSPDSPAWHSYGLDMAHKHIPEMQAHAGLSHAPIFAPAVVPAVRGMIVEIPLHADAGFADRARETLAEAYRSEPVIDVADKADNPTQLVIHEDSPASDRLTLAVYGNPDGSQARLVARFDNLGKGASGACVQNLNLMAGFTETDGLVL